MFVARFVTLALAGTLAPSVALAQTEPEPEPEPAPFWVQPAPPVERAATQTPAVSTPAVSATAPAPSAAPEVARTAYTLERGPDTGWVITGAVTLVVGYLGALPFAIVGLTREPIGLVYGEHPYGSDRPWCHHEMGGLSLIPFVGTLVGVIHLTSCEQRGIGFGDFVLPALPAIVQTFGFAALLGGLFANVATGGVVEAGELRILPYAPGGEVGVSLALRTP